MQAALIMCAVSYTRLSTGQQLFLHLLSLSTHWGKLPVPWLSEAGVPRPTEQHGFLKDETQTGSISSHSSVFP